MNDSLDNDYKILPDSNNKTIATIFALGSAITIMSVALISSIQYSSKLKAPVYLVKPDGSIEIATPGKNEHRSDEVISTVAESWLKMSYEWDLLGPKKNKPCVAKVTAIAVIVPCRVHDASFLLSPRVRYKFLRLAAALSAKRGIYNSEGIYSIVEIYFTSIPQQTNRDTYYVDIIASQVFIKESVNDNGLTVREEIEDEILNNRIFLKNIPLDRLVLPKLETITYRRKIHSLLSTGLIITDIKPIEVPTDFRKPIPPKRISPDPHD